MKLKSLMLLALVVPGLAGCGSTGSLSKDGLSAPMASKAAPPKVVQHEDQLLAALACFRQSPVSKFGYVVDTVKDNTGKVNAVAEGSTGAFLPQDAAPFLIAAINKAGATSYDYRQIETVRRMREMGGAVAVNYQTGLRNKSVPQLAISGEFTAMDFTGSTGADVRVAGVGPTATVQGAIITGFMQIVDPNTLRVLAQSDPIRQTVFYKELGVGVGKSFSGTLVTGNAGIGDQQQMQFEAARRPMMWGVAQAFSRLPEAPAGCQEKVGKVVAGQV